MHIHKWQKLANARQCKKCRVLQRFKNGKWVTYLDSIKMMSYGPAVSSRTIGETGPAAIDVEEPQLAI